MSIPNTANTQKKKSKNTNKSFIGTRRFRIT